MNPHPTHSGLSLLGYMHPVKAVIPFPHLPEGSRTQTSLVITTGKHSALLTFLGRISHPRVAVAGAPSQAQKGQEHVPPEGACDQAQSRCSEGLEPCEEELRSLGDRLPTGALTCSANFSVEIDREFSRFQAAFLCPMLVVEFLVAVASNGLAFYRFVTREQRPWHPAVVFSAQLAISDLLYALTLLPLAAYFYPPKNWQYGEFACRLERFLFTCNLLGSVIFVTCISLNRYLGIVHPFFTRSSWRPKHAWAVSAAGWALAALLAAPTLSFSHLKRPQREGSCVTERPEACTKCLGMADDLRLEAYRAYTLVLAVLGCGVPLLLTLTAYSALGWAVLRSHGMTAAEKLRVAALVASSLALYASSYVPYYITQVLNVQARQRWRARCPGFASLNEAKAAVDQMTYRTHQIMRGLMPLAICIHPLLYMAVAPSLGCCHQSCCSCSNSQMPEDTGNSGQVLPLNVTATPPKRGALVP